MTCERRTGTGIRNDSNLERATRGLSIGQSGLPPSVGVSETLLDVGGDGGVGEETCLEGGYSDGDSDRGPLVLNHPTSRRKSSSRGWRSRRLWLRESRDAGQRIQSI